jgi:hypothetical protein
MYAFIVNEAWLKYDSKNASQFLRDIGTPSLLMNPNDLNTTFNNVSGFYVKIEEGWAVRFNSELVTYDASQLASTMASLNMK